MAGYLDRSDDSITHVVDFDYTHFLCAPRQENWTLYTLVLAKISYWFKGSATSSACYFTNETFTRLVCRSLSSLCSDVANLETLIEEAKKQGVKELKIILPYALDELELRTLQQIKQVEISQYKTDREFLRVRCR